jgi:hypothetical protein
MSCWYLIAYPFYPILQPRAPSQGSFRNLQKRADKVASPDSATNAAAYLANYFIPFDDTLSFPVKNVFRDYAPPNFEMNKA